MKFDKKSSKTATTSDADSPVDAENWVERAKAHIVANDGLGFVIIGPDAPYKVGRPTPAQWRAWLGYLADHKIPTVNLRSQCKGTMPTEWPEDFDKTAPLSDRLWTPLRDLPRTDAEMAVMQNRVSGLFRGLSNGLTPTKRNRQGEVEPAAALSPTEHLEHLRQAYAGTPVELSPEALAILGEMI